MTSYALLGSYFANVVMSAIAAWFLFSRLVDPIVKARKIDLDRLAIGIGAMFAMTGHLWENAWYGTARWFDFTPWLISHAAFAVIGKVLISVGVVFTLAGLAQPPVIRVLPKLAGACLGLWALGMAFAWGLK